GSGPVRPRVSTPPPGRAATSSPTQNPPARRFPAAMSYPPLSDKARTPVTPGQQQRPPVPDTSSQLRAPVAQPRIPAPGGSPAPPSAAAGTPQQIPNRTYNRTVPSG